MGRYKKNLGDFGEMAAEEYLINCGYEILCRNFLVRGGEIDIVAKDGDMLAFVEVKTRSSQKFGYPSEAVDKKKIGHMLTAAEEYLRQNPTDCEIRFDVIEVIAVVSETDANIEEINHIKGILID